MEFFLCVMGMVMIVEGVPYFLAPHRMKAVVMVMAALPDASLRRVGGVLMVLGMAVVYLARWVF